MLNLLFIGVPWEYPKSRVYTATHSTLEQGFKGFVATKTGLPYVFPFRSSALPDLIKLQHGSLWHPDLVNFGELCCGSDSPMSISGCLL